MKPDHNRSKQVIDDFKKRRLAASALHRIHEIIGGFEQERAADLRLARIGLVIVLVLIGLAIYFFLGIDRITLS